MKIIKKIRTIHSIKFGLIAVVALMMLPDMKLSAQIQAKPADSFVDMTGAVVHVARNYTQYTSSTGNPIAEQNTINCIKNIGLRHLRDGIYGWNGGDDPDKDGRTNIQRISTISDSTGITWIFVQDNSNYQSVTDRISPLGNRVAVLEGPNEAFGTKIDSIVKGNWNNIRPQLPYLKFATQSGPTLPCLLASEASLNEYVDFGCAHPYQFMVPFKPFGLTTHCQYSGSCAPPTAGLWTSPDNSKGTMGYIEGLRSGRIALDKPIIFSEWGYPTISNDKNGWGVDELAAAKYMTRVFLEHFKAGIVYSCSYELMDNAPLLPFNDDPEAHFGLAYYDGSLKPSGLAVKRLIELLDDKGNKDIVTGSLDYSLSGGGGLSFVDDYNATTNEIHQVLLQKADSTFYLILWQEAISTNSSGKSVDVPAVNVTINFGETISGILAYLPATTDNTFPIADTSGVQTFSVSVPDHPVVIEIIKKKGAIPVNGININADTAVIKVGQTIKLKATITPYNASIKGVNWRSNDNSVAQISFKGELTGKSAGQAIITATSIDGNLTDSSLVTVNAVPLTDISLNTSEITLAVNESYTLKVNFNPADASNKAIYWSSGDTSIVKVNSEGILTGISSGAAIVTALSPDGGRTAVCQVTVKDFVIIDDSDAGWTWSGYSNDPCSSCYKGTAHSTNIQNAFTEYSFRGTEITAYCETWAGAGTIDIFIDNIYQGSFSQDITPYGGAMKFAEIIDLQDTMHAIRFVSASNIWTGIDYIRYVGVAPLKGLLTGSFGFNYTKVNLSLGTTDWKHFAGNAHKAEGAFTNLISDYEVINGTAAVYTDDLRPMSWNGGSPVETSSDNTSGTAVSGLGKGFSFTVDAGDGTDTLNVYVSGNAGGGTLSAQLSNGVAADFEKTVATSRSGKWDGIFKLIYDAKQDGQFLEIKWTQATDKGSIGLQAAGISEKSGITAIEDLSNGKSSSIQVYPNPARNLVTIDFANSLNNELSQIKIVDMAGKKVYESAKASRNSTLKIDTGKFPKGVYVLKTTLGNVMYNIKLIIE